MARWARERADDARAQLRARVRRDARRSVTWCACPCASVCVRVRPRSCGPAFESGGVAQPAKQ